MAGGDDVTITVRATEHGPLMSDVGETEQEIAAQETAIAEKKQAIEAIKQGTLDARALQDFERSS